MELKKVLTKAFLLAVFCAGSGFAETVTFQGTVDNDLARAENWPNNTLPGPNDLVELNASAGACSFLCSGDVSFRGIRVVNSGGCAYNLLTNGTDAATITLGDCGITNTVSISDKTAVVELQTSFATTGAQIWKFLTADGVKVRFRGTISGSSDLTLEIGPYIEFYQALGYGGRIVFARVQRYPSVTFRAAGRYAEKIYCDTGYIYFCVACPGEVRLQDLFGEVNVAKSTNAGLRVTGTSTELTIDDETIVSNTGDGGKVEAGAVVRVEGTAKSNYCGVDGVFGLGRGVSMLGAFYLSSGAVWSGVSAEYYKLMLNNSAGDLNNLFEQTGGMSQHSSLWIGGVGGSAASISTYVIDGGVTAVTNANHTVRKSNGNNNPGLHIVPEGSGATSCGVGILSLRKGALVTPFVAFGHGISVSDTAWSENKGKNWSTNQFGVFEMSGGRLTTYSRPFCLGDNWNVDASSIKVADAVGSYRVKFSGGTYEPLADATIPLQCEVQPGETPFTVDAAHAVDFIGPVWGSGAFVKTGAKAVSLRDAARFHGSLDVQEGVLNINPAVAAEPSVAVPEGGEEWVADSLTGEDGATVDAWTGSGNTTASVSTSKTENKPVLQKGAVNGKALIRFGGKGSLVIPGESSPIAGQTDFAVALVFRTIADSLTDTGSSGIRVSGTVGPIGCRQTISTTTTKQKTDWGFAWHAGGTLVSTLGGNGVASKTIFSRKPCRLDDGVLHVAVFSADVTNGRLMQMIDGLPTAVTTTLRDARTQDVNLALGALGTSDGNQGYFTGDIAAVRIYKKALTTDEMAQLTKHYCDRYGLMPLAREEFSAADAKGGLGATNITVAAGATLALPTDVAFKLASGRMLANAGSVSGALELADGATLACACGADPLPSYGAVTVKGTVTVSVSGVPAEGGSLRQPLFAYESINLTDGQLVPVGTNVDPTVHAIVCKNGKAYLRRDSGVLLILR